MRLEQNFSKFCFRLSRLKNSAKAAFLYTLFPLKKWGIKKHPLLIKIPGLCCHIGISIV